MARRVAQLQTVEAIAAALGVARETVRTQLSPCSPKPACRAKAIWPRFWQGQAFAATSSHSVGFTHLGDAQPRSRFTIRIAKRGGDIENGCVRRTEIDIFSVDRRVAFDGCSTKGREGISVCLG